MDDQKSTSWADIRDARLAGRAPRSVASVRLFSVASALICCAVGGAAWFESVLTLVREGFRAGHIELDVLLTIGYRAAWACGATAVVAIVVGILLTYVHTGFLWSLGLVTPALSRRFERYERVQGERWSMTTSLVAIVVSIVVSGIGLRVLLPECVRLLTVSAGDLSRSTLILARFCFAFDGVVFGIGAFVLAIGAWISFFLRKTAEPR